MKTPTTTTTTTTFTEGTKKKKKTSHAKKKKICQNDGRRDVREKTLYNSKCCMQIEKR